MLVSTYYQAMSENLLNCGIKIMKYGAKNGDQGNKMKGYKEMCLLSEHAHWGNKGRMSLFIDSEFYLCLDLQGNCLVGL